MIKIIALVSMILDHIGLYLYPDLIIFRVIGRLAFPLFAFSLVEGFIYSNNLCRYSLRLVLAGIAAQPAYNYLHTGGLFWPWEKLNICFTLALGLLFIYCLWRWKWYCLLLLPAFYIVEYGLYAPVLLLIFYYFISPVVLYEQHWLKIKAVVYMALASFVFFPGIQLFSILSLPLILHRKISLIRFPKLKSFFYIFYPAHLIIFTFLVNWL